ncbi:unnamed protein product [Rhizoctonia solani]|uniref:F-box domain-containing protein n=2 Tax=Rhizoctonia solani TaxID=456999 RepID=A0A8H3HAA4_9AGAM|nr:F-box protein [Rhizoctonia solani AG-3 Rhs1AP]CAE6382481.1 unnamed protein product [Rhizoctonia solani]CAE6497599.1 unnamed protein product [Rhizoctonia solani]
MPSVIFPALTSATHSPMTRLESLPFDIIHIIVSHLTPHDFPAVALVCHLFNSATTPKIYANIRYTHQLAKQWGQILCPVELLGARSDLLAHLKSLDLRAVPLYKGAPHPQFIRACIHVVQHAPGLASFSWATAGLYEGLLVNILRILALGNGTTSRNRAGTTCEKASMLDGDHDADNTNTKLLRLSLTEDGLSSSDAHILQRLGPVEHMALHKPSVGATRALVEWVTSAADSPLTSLAMSNNYHLDAPLLERILANTRKLKSLSITNCLRIEPCSLFSIISNTGFELEFLAFTLPRDTEYDTLGATFPSLPTLRHLSVLIEPPNEPDPDRHTHAPTDPLAQRLFRHLFKAIRNVKLYSLTLRLASHRTLTPKLLNALIITQGQTLRRLNLFKLAVSAHGVADVLRHVSNLEQLSLELGGVLDGLDLIIEALPAAQHLYTLIDTSPTVSATHRRPTTSKSRALTRAQATQLLEAGPVLGNVVSQQRNWAKEYVWTAGRFELGVSMRKVRAI